MNSLPKIIKERLNNHESTLYSNIKIQIANFKALELLHTAIENINNIFSYN